MSRLDLFLKQRLFRLSQVSNYICLFISFVLWFFFAFDSKYHHHQIWFFPVPFLMFLVLNADFIVLLYYEKHIPTESVFIFYVSFQRQIACAFIPVVENSCHISLSKKIVSFKGETGKMVEFGWKDNERDKLYHCKN